MMLTPEQLAELRNGKRGLRVEELVKGNLYFHERYGWMKYLGVTTYRWESLPDFQIMNGPPHGDRMMRPETIAQEFIIKPDETTLQLLAHIDAQQERIAELEKDAARYRWLREFGYGLPRLGGELDTSIDAAMQPAWPEDTSDYGSRIAIVGQNGNDGLAYQEEQP